MGSHGDDCRVQGLGFRVKGLRASGLAFRVQSSKFTFLGSRVPGSGFADEGPSSGIASSIGDRWERSGTLARSSHPGSSETPLRV